MTSKKVKAKVKFIVRGIVWIIILLVGVRAHHAQPYTS